MTFRQVFFRLSTLFSYLFLFNPYSTYLKFLLFNFKFRRAEKTYLLFEMHILLRFVALQSIGR